ncbi:nucleotide-diphospho-sugar transferase [Auriculariales sp. MPI-PUGE-AT-0066]|nr:nucleotide-diphospho-sugar transferase [Auriculariales sp. MPI-PUGE-AT-0066]
MPRAGPSEFTAVLIAGFGEELRPLTSDHQDEPSAKALLSVANKPLISFPLAWLEEAGVTDVLLLCPESHRSGISHYLSSDASSSSFPKLSIAVRTFLDVFRNDPSKGTATVLAQFASDIEGDFIVLPCDLIPPPSLKLSTVLDRFRMDPTGLLAAALFYRTAPPPTNPLVPGETLEAPPAVLLDASDTLLKIEEDVDAEELDLRMEMLWSHPRSTLRTDLRDAHVYVFRHQVLSMLDEDVHRFQSIRADLVPWLVEIQHRARRRTRWSARLPPAAERTVMEHSTAHAFAARNPERRPRGADTGDTVIARCAIVVADAALRVNTLSALLEANRAEVSAATFIPDSSHVLEPQVQVEPNNIVGSSTRIGERSSIKQSVIGAHCTIGKNVRIKGSVIMDHCVLADGAKVDGCILGTRTSVGEKAQLVQCFTQPGYEIAAGGASEK